MKLSHFIAPAFATLFSIGTAFADQPHQQALPVEIFTITDKAVQGESIADSQEALQHIDIQIYELDRIRRIEEKLSKNLIADQAKSKQVVLKRIQNLARADRARMQHAAMGLAKAIQYGIDRYPAIVFDGRIVIYGVTDIGDGLQRYQQWREGQK